MRVTFWGVRGSYPVPGRSTVRYGGHTSCVQVDAGDGSTFVLDAGTGLRALGKKLAEGALGRGEGKVNLFLSHLHWDHVQGLPFFKPVFARGNRLVIHARGRKGTSLNESIAGVAGEAVFAVKFQDLPANFKFVPVRPCDAFEVDGVEVLPIELNHPGTATGFRLDWKGRSVAYITDTSPFDRILFKTRFARGAPRVLPGADRRALAMMRKRLIDSLEGVDLLIHDAHFTTAEYESLPHWGHSTPEQALLTAQEAGVPRLVLFHHAPDRSDEAMDQLFADIRARAAGTGVQVEVAIQGQSLEVS